MNTPDTSFTEEQIISHYWQLSPLHGELWRMRLDPTQRRKKGGLLLPFGPGLVATVAQGLCEKPHLFPDAPAPGPDLLARQKIAYGWLLLRDRLRDMAQLAADAYLAAQTELTDMALSFTDNATHQIFPPQLPAADIPSRNMAMIPAILLLHAYYKAKNKVRARNQAAAERAVAQQNAAAGEAGAAGPAAPQSGPAAATTDSPAPRPKSRARIRAEAEHRAHDRATLRRALESFLWSRAGAPGVNIVHEREHSPDRAPSSLLPAPPLP